MTTYTSTLRLIEPQVLGDDGQWATYLNNDLVAIDQGINQTKSMDLTGLTSYTILADGSTSDEARYAAWNFFGTLSADCTVTIPLASKVGMVRNFTSGGFNVILSNGLGLTRTLPADQQWWRIMSFTGNPFSVWPQEFGTISTGNPSVYTLPRSLKIQRGTSTLVTANLPVTFTTAFSNTSYSLVVGVGRNDGATVTPSAVGYTNKATGGFTITASVLSSSFNVDWIAIGF